MKFIFSTQLISRVLGSCNLVLIYSDLWRVVGMRIPGIPRMAAQQ
jgi:hypothetical protein